MVPSMKPTTSTIALNKQNNFFAKRQIARVVRLQLLIIENVFLLMLMLLLLYAVVVVIYTGSVNKTDTGISDLSNARSGKGVGKVGQGSFKGAQYIKYRT